MRLRSSFPAILIVAFLGVCAYVSWATGEDAVSFTDASAEWGLSAPLKGIMAHAAACGDIDGDGDLDIYVGTFCDRPAKDYVGRDGPAPNILLINRDGKYVAATAPHLAIAKRTSGAVFVDFDNDGDLDLYITNNSKKSQPGFCLENKSFSRT